MPAYKRILLKLSGEALMGDDAYGINRATIVRIVQEVREVTQLGCELALVIGGGNIFRGVAGGSVGMDRATADYMGMLATVMNALACADTMRQEGMTARVMSAIAIEQVVEPYVRPKALQYLEEGKIVIFAAGTGNPFFTTDTAAALRAALHEMTDQRSGGEPVVIVHAPGKLMDQRAERERAVDHPAGDDDIGAGAERVGDRKGAEIGVHAADRLFQRQALAVEHVVQAGRGVLGGAASQVIAFDNRDLGCDA